MSYTGLGSDTSCIILAAGEGKRMHSKKSKVLCEVAFKPMINWVIDSARGAGIENICVVVSSDDVRAAADGCTVCEQKERLGTGHAVMCADSFLKDHRGDVLILCGDAPFISSDVISSALREHRQSKNKVTVISAVLSDPAGYGRIVREDGGLKAIVEARDCTDEQLSIDEINSGAYWFDADALGAALLTLRADNAQGEYYLTDTLRAIAEAGGRAGCFTAPTPDVVLGANSPADLLELNRIAERRIIARHLENGVRFVSLDGVVIGPDVEIEAGAEILQGTTVYGKTRIGAGSVVGPNSLLEDAEIGRDVEFLSSFGRRCTVGDGARIGPFAHLRPGSHIGPSVKLGDFVEIKNSTVGEGTSVAHLTYIGDSDVGKHCNFGCGVVVANYDGSEKHRTEVGDFAFVGCNTNLIPPVRVGSRAYTAAGVTITSDVPDGALAVGRAKQSNLEGVGERKLKKYIEKKSG